MTRAVSSAMENHFGDSQMAQPNRKIKKSDPPPAIVEFDTPAELASRMVALAKITTWDNVLEPSAGTGSLVGALASLPEKCHIHAVEINERRCRNLIHAFGGSRFVQVDQADFLEWIDETDPYFDAVLMNPPPARDIEHIQAAWSLLEK